jgi:ribosomal protein S18 acetylase RimI-like enzyme
MIKTSYRTEARPEDRENVGRLVAKTGFFSAEEIYIAEELISERLAKGEDSGYFFLFAEENQLLAGYACFGPIPGTLQRFDLYWIVVDPSLQRRGIGRSLLNAVEREVAARGGGRIYIDTSSRPQYESTRRFYASCGYREDALLRDFYAPGDGKVIFVKSL